MCVPPTRAYVYVCRMLLPVNDNYFQLIVMYLSRENGAREIMGEREEKHTGKHFERAQKKIGEKPPRGVIGMLILPMQLVFFIFFNLSTVSLFSLLLI